MSLGREGRASHTFSKLKVGFRQRQRHRKSAPYFTGGDGSCIWLIAVRVYVPSERRLQASFPKLAEHEWANVIQLILLWCERPVRMSGYICPEKEGIATDGTDLGQVAGGLCSAMTSVWCFAGGVKDVFGATVWNSTCSVAVKF